MLDAFWSHSWAKVHCMSQNFQAFGCSFSTQAGWWLSCKIEERETWSTQPSEQTASKLPGWCSWLFNFVSLFRCFSYPTYMPVFTDTEQLSDRVQFHLPSLCWNKSIPLLLISNHLRSSVGLHLPHTKTPHNMQKTTFKAVPSYSRRLHFLTLYHSQLHTCWHSNATLEAHDSKTHNQDSQKLAKHHHVYIPFQWHYSQKLACLN